MAPMNCNRASFAHTVVENKVYVFGGLSGKHDNAPILADSAAEVYDPISDKWERIEIQNALSLAAFGWTTLGSPEQIMILGGSDGEILQEECYIVDFKARVATRQ